MADWRICHRHRKSAPSRAAQAWISPRSSGACSIRFRPFPSSGRSLSVASFWLGFQTGGCSHTDYFIAVRTSCGRPQLSCSDCRYSRRRGGTSSRPRTPLAEWCKFGWKHSPPGTLSDSWWRSWAPKWSWRFWEAAFWSTHGKREGFAKRPSARALTCAPCF